MARDSDGDRRIATAAELDEEVLCQRKEGRGRERR